MAEQKEQLSILIAEIDAVLEQGRRLVREEERWRRREEEVQEEKRRRTEADGKKLDEKAKMYRRRWLVLKWASFARGLLWPQCR